LGNLSVAELVTLLDVVGSMPAGMEDDDFDTDLVSFTFTAPDYNPALNESISVNSIFQVLTTLP